MKEKMKKMSGISSVVALILALTSCTNTNVPSQNITNDTGTDNVQTTVIEVTEAKYKDEDYYSDWTFDNQISLNGDSVAVSGMGMNVSGSNVEITNGGTYVISGTLNNGQITVNATKNDLVRLVLNGANITSTDTSAIYVKQADKVVITLADGSENIITDGSEYAATSTDENTDVADTTIYSDDDLTINGTGTLTVNSNYNDAIKTKNDLVIMSGTINVNSVDDGFVGKDSILIKDGNFTVNVTGDGFKSTETELDKGYITVENGVFNIVAGKDAFQAESTAYFINGTYDITTGEGGETVKVGNMMQPPNGGMGGRPPQMPGENGGMMQPPPQGGMNGQPPQMPGENGEMMPPQGEMGGGRPPQMPGENGEMMQPPQMPEDMQQNTEEDTTESKKGIKAVNNITILGGTFNLNTEDDAIHSNFYTAIKGGTFNIKTSDDAVHGDDTLEISGGEIVVVNSYEALEANNIKISDGNISIKSSDDAINAADGSGRYSMSGGNSTLEITGGTIKADAQGDGLDANGSITMTGGEVYVDGPTGGGNSTLDYNATFNVNGGILVGAGTRDMAQNVSKTSEQGTIFMSFSEIIEANKTVVLKDSDGNKVMEYTPSKSYGVILLSSAEIEKGKTYTISVDGTDIVTFEMSDTVVSVNKDGVTTNIGGHGAGGMGQAPNGNRGGRERQQKSQAQQEMSE